MTVASTIAEFVVAWTNGVLAYVLDFDDVGVRAQGHPSAVLFPAALAVARITDENIAGSTVA